MRLTSALVALILAATAIAGWLLYSGPGRSVDAIVAGGGHSCALRGGDVYCWGANDSGQLGNGTTLASPRPVRVQGLGGRAEDVVAGLEFSCALLEDGRVQCWGQGGDGQLGDGRASTSFIPVDVEGIDDAVALSAGYWHSCAVSEDSGVTCWGQNWNAQLGDGTNFVWAGPVEALDANGAALRGVTAVATGLGHSCALMEDTTVQCWGWNAQGQLGHESEFICGQDFSEACSAVPLHVLDGNGGVLHDVDSITAGMGHTCAVLVDGSLTCWGQNDMGQVGNGDDVAQYAPVEVIGLDGGAASVSSWGVTTCATTEDGAAMCWGSNLSGQLGTGAMPAEAPNPEPGSVLGLGTGVTAISAGGEHVCAVQGVLKCWGENYAGTLGAGTAGEPVARPLVVRFAGRSEPLTALLIAFPLVVTAVVISVGVAQRARRPG